MYLQESEEDIDEDGGYGEGDASGWVCEANCKVEGVGLLAWCQSIDNPLVVYGNVDIDHPTRDKDQKTHNNTKLEGKMTYA